MVCVRDETQIMPDYNTHGFAYISPAIYKETAGFDYYPQINVISSLSKKEFADKADEALDTTLMILTKDETFPMPDLKVRLKRERLWEAYFRFCFC